MGTHIAGLSIARFYHEAQQKKCIVITDDFGDCVYLPIGKLPEILDAIITTAGEYQAELALARNEAERKRQQRHRARMLEAKNNS